MIVLCLSTLIYYVSKRRMEKSDLERLISTEMFSDRKMQLVTACVIVSTIFGCVLWVLFWVLGIKSLAALVFGFAPVQ